MKEQLLRLLDYEHWANQQVITALDSANTPPPRAVEVMNHILAAQQVWFGRITGQAANVALWEITSVPYIAVAAERNYQQFHAYVNQLTSEELTHPIAYKNLSGEPFTNSLLDIMIHLSHHAAYHRGQVVQAIRPLISNVPKTDYIFWVRKG